MKESRRENLLIGFSLFMIAATAGGYVSLIRGWLSGTPPAQGPAPRPRSPVPQELLAARLHFRDNLLDPRASLRLSEALYAAGRPVDSFYVMSEARAFFGEEAFWRAHRAVILQKDSAQAGAELHDPAPANEERLKTRLKTDPYNPLLLKALGRIAAERGELKEARKYLEMGLATNPQDRGLLATLSELTAVSDPLGAISFQARLIHAGPDSHEARAALAELGRLAKSKEEGPLGEIARLAREALEELGRAHPTHPGIFSTLALALWARGEIDTVRAMVHEASSRRPGHAGAAMVGGALALQDRHTDKAIKSFTAAWEKNPDDLYSAGKLAQLYLRQRDDREAALPYYIALYRQNPRYDDGEPAEILVRETLDSRRRQVLTFVGAEGLGRYLGSEDASLRAEACAKAGAAADPRWIDALAGLLNDDTDAVRHGADSALFEIAKKHPEAVAARREEWLADRRPLLRARALNLFADLDAQGTFPRVARALYDPHPAVRFFAKTMVLDRYYKDLPAAAKVRAEYIAAEKDPSILALYTRAKTAPGAAPR